MDINKVTQCEKTYNSLKRDESISIENKEQIRREKDSVEISVESKLLHKLQETTDIRKEKVDEIKKLLVEEGDLSQEKIKLGIKKMIILMFGDQNFSNEM